jgi:hypothetical protein
MTKVVSAIFSPIASLFGLGGNDANQQAAQAAQLKAQQLQQRELYASQEQQAQIASEQDASGRRLRGIGRQALAFQGNTLGIAPDLSAGASAVTSQG